jgi:hypothetical protein
MRELIRVEWEAESPFLVFVMALIARIAHYRKGEPTEALGYVWVVLRKHYEVGEVVDSRDILLKSIIVRKMIDFYRRENPSRMKTRRVSLDEVYGEDITRNVKMSVDVRNRSPDKELANRELALAIEAALADLDPQRREAAQSRLRFAGVPGAGDLARVSRVSTQHIHKRANQGLAVLRAALASFV